MTAVATSTYDIEKIRKDFPILNREVNGHPLVYFDNAATTQKPQAVIDAIVDYYSNHNSNIHRGVHSLADEATQAYEDTRESLRKFIGARTTKEIIFTSGTTDGINLVASTISQQFNPGDEVIVTGMEHHSNMVPWQIAAKQYQLNLRYVELEEDGTINLDSFRSLLSNRTKIVSIVYASNSLGTINPVREIIAAAHENGALVLLDAAQACAHIDIDVQELDCDFMAFSGHKMYGPTGIGVLYGKETILSDLPPYRGGGEMISEVTVEGSTWNELPYKFEAGTPNIADVIAWKPAIDYIESLTKEQIRAHENELTAYATSELLKIGDVTIYAENCDKVSVVSFNLNDVHPYDVGMMLDARGVAVRTGHHCTQPLMDRYKIEGTVRASFAMYNTKAEIDVMIAGLKRIKQILKP